VLIYLKLPFCYQLINFLKHIVRYIYYKIMHFFVENICVEFDRKYNKMCLYT